MLLHCMHKTKKLEIRITDQLLTDLKKLAEIENTTVSEYVRYLIVKDRDYKFSTDGIKSLIGTKSDKIDELHALTREKIKTLEEEIKKYNEILIS